MDRNWLQQDLAHESEIDLQVTQQFSSNSNEYLSGMNYNTQPEQQNSDLEE